MNSDYGLPTDLPEDEKETIARRLSEALQENRGLHDRIAELDISMNIESVELQKEIETLRMERDQLSRINETLIEDYTSKDLKIQDLLRQLEIKQLMIDETSSYLGTAIDRIKSLERQCTNLELRHAGLSSAATPSEPAETEGSNSLIEDIRKEFEETLGQKDIEIETLQKNMEMLQEKNRYLEEEKAEIEKEKVEAPETPASLENALMEMEHSLLGLEQRISRASEIGSTEKEEILIRLDDAHREIFSLREYHRSLLDALRQADEESRKSVFSYSDYHQSITGALRAKEKEYEALRSEMADTVMLLSQRDEAIRKLNERVEEEENRNLSLNNESGRQLEAAVNRAEDLESELERERKSAALLKDAAAQKDTIIRELQGRFETEAGRLEAEAAESRTAAESAAARSGQLEAIVVRNSTEIGALSSELAGQQTVIEERNRQIAELTDRLTHLEADKRNLAKASEDYISALQNTIGIKDDELRTSAGEKELLKTELLETRRAASAGAEENTRVRHKEMDELQRQNSELASRILSQEKNAALEEIKESVSLEIRRLSERVEMLKEERLSEKAALKEDIDRSFSRITESTERLEHALSEGMPLVKKLEELSSEILRGDIPAVYTAVPQEPEKPGRSLPGTLTVFLLVLLLAVAAAGLYFMPDLYRTGFQKTPEASAPVPVQWASGTRQAQNGQYGFRLTFLTKEAVQVLGFSDLISEADLARSTYALIEIRNNGGCIPEEFITAPEKNMNFADDRGAIIQLNDAGALSEWKKTIYKQNACGAGKAGTIYMKHIISVPKGHSLQGLAIRGLADQAIIIK